MHAFKNETRSSLDKNTSKGYLSKDTWMDISRVKVLNLVPPGRVIYVFVWELQAKKQPFSLLISSRLLFLKPQRMGIK